MKAQKPAEGILQRHDWGDTKYYQVVCSCGQEYHDHNVEVEADDHSVNVNIYATVKTNYWTDAVETRYNIDNEILQEIEWFVKGLINSTIRKIKVTWELWTTGAITTETTISMTEQQAINYAETLKTAAKDCREFHEQRVKAKQK